MRLKVGAQSILNLGVLAIIILASFLSPLQQILPLKYMYTWYVIATVLVYTGACLKSGLRIDRMTAINILPWLGVFCFFLYRNADLKYGHYEYFAIGFFSILMMFALASNSGWHRIAIKAVAITSCVHVFATIFFFFNSSLWKKYSFAVYGGYVSGSNRGETGYAAALNGHYSTNGTLTAFFALSLIGAFLFSRTKKNKKRYAILIILALVATLLTSKRAHTLFLAVTFIIVYFLANWKENAFKTMLKIVSIVIVAYFAIIFIVNYIPALSTVFSRFLTIGQDDQTLTRFVMWEYAYDMFTTEPIYGIGWGAYRYRFSSLNMYEGAANAHNIYLQLLAETGVIGFALFIWAAFRGLKGSIYMMINANKLRLDYNEKIIATFSCTFQIFLLLYGLTGNPIYDFCFIYYMISVAMSYSLLSRLRKPKWRNGI